ncbi:MAG TPA: DUF4214 domain-containing protein [Pyrinomonadaceae bacterium]
MITYCCILLRIPSVRIFLAFSLVTSLLLLPNAPFMGHGKAWNLRQGRSETVYSSGQPRPGKPEANLPNLDTMRTAHSVERGVQAPIPSTIRSRKNAARPWDGRRVGEEQRIMPSADQPQARSGINQRQANVDTSSEVSRRAHAKRQTLPSSPTILDDTFIDNFYTCTLPLYLPTPMANEKAYWRNQLRVGYQHGQGSLRLAAIELGKTLFESAAYAARNRSNQDYVWDLYATYLMRDAGQDQSGWTFWTNVVSSSGRENVRLAFEESTEFANKMADIVPNGSATSDATSFLASRVDPRTQPANGLLTRDVSWSISILDLPGRSGLDLGLTLSYSSQVWTRSGPFIYFDEDNGFPSAGFRLGFPVVQRKTFNAETATNGYLLITPVGQRVELRQVGASNIYESADSSYLQLTDNGTSWLVRSTDGTRLTFIEQNNEYHCSEIKDRNGNYISVNYDAWGHITNVTDTLGRLITFNYDSNHNLLSIAQTWNGSAHTWATFAWTNKTLALAFSEVAVVGATDGGTIPVINQVSLDDGTYYQFDYQSYGQINAIKRYHGADNPAVLRFQKWFSYASPGADVARLSTSNLNVYNWTGINGVPANVTTTYGVDGDDYVMTAPDGTYVKESYGTGWKKGLITASEIWSGGVKQKWTTTNWTQDDETKNYQLNPRITETNIYDKDRRRKRTSIEYWSQFGLPHLVAEYAGDGTNVLRYTNYDYKNDSAYVDRRIIGLPFRVTIMDGGWNLKAKTEYAYDLGGGDLFYDTPAAATQHDRTNYGPSFTEGRGNLSLVQRYDITDPNNTNNTAVETRYRVNSTGSVLMVRDHLSHQKFIAYGDSFSDAINRNTFAYPTTLTDEESHNSYIKYNFDFGAITRTEAPAPAGQTQGLIQTMSYYATSGQLERVTTANNGAYQRFWYGPDSVASFTTINNIADEAYSNNVYDGLGRLIGAASNFPGSNGGYKAQLISYDLMGRTNQVSNPAEINGYWVPAGDDVGGWMYTQQTYDWKGRPLLTTNQDGTTKTAEYTGCGCAGETVVTLTDEGTMIGTPAITKKRQKRIYSDVLGRTTKTEILNWNGDGPYGTAPNNTVYAATVNTYDPLDHITRVRQYAGPEGGGTYQDMVMSYDGLGRLKTKHRPDQSSGMDTSYTYNHDDTLASVTDARGAVTTFEYNNRHLTTGMSSTLGSETISVTNSYDAAGNRTSTSHTVNAAAKDSIAFSYDQLSRITSETRHINALDSYAPNYGYFTIAYNYTLSGALQSVTDPFSSPTNFTYDSTGRTAGVTGSYGGTNYTYANSISYRAWGAVKAATFNNTINETVTFDARLQPEHFRLTSGGFNLMRYDYNYHDDGALQQLMDLDDQMQQRPFHYMARAYSYDQAGRNVSVAPASNHGGIASPFTGTYAYDEFNNPTGRSAQYGVGLINPTTDFATYVNNRRNGWIYDADGRLITSTDTTNPAGSTTRNWYYDATGKLISITEGTTSTLSYDGDVELLYESVSGGSSDYSIRSTVLGSVLTKLDSSGVKTTTYVPTNNLVMALQDKDWQGNPTVGFINRDILGMQEGSSAYDPVGNLIYNVDPPNSQQLVPWYGPTYGSAIWSSMNANNLAVGCVWDGIPTQCRNIHLSNDQGMNADGLTTSHISGGIVRTVYGDGSRLLSAGETGAGQWQVTVAPDPSGDSFVIDPFENSVASFANLTPLGPQNSGNLIDAKFDITRFNNCVKSLFVVDPRPSPDNKAQGLVEARQGVGSYSGYSYLLGREFTLYTDARSKTSNQLSKEEGLPPGTVYGRTNPSNPYLNYVASDHVGIVALADQVHETGNSISYIIANSRSGAWSDDLQMTVRQVYRHPEPQRPDITDQDPGSALEECVFGGPVLKDGKVY